jgi:uncharacterized protein (DUF58 family)
MARKTGVNCGLGRLGDILIADIFPAITPYFRWLRTPLASLTLAAMAAVSCGLILNPRGLLIFFGLLALLGLGIVWPWLGVRGLAGTLSFDRGRIREGEPVVLHLSLKNRMPWSAWGLQIEGGFRASVSSGGEADPAPGLAHAPGWRTTVASWVLIPNGRGVYPPRTPRIRSGFPFGLFQARRPLEVNDRLLVWPRTLPVGPIPGAAVGRASEGLTPRETAGTFGDVMGVRPYRRGDSLRRIHWPQTARHDRLVICEQQTHASPRIQVVLDTHDDVHAGDGPSGSREWAIRLAASFLEHWTGQGAEVEAVFEGQVVAPKECSVASRRVQFLDALARLVPTGFWSLNDLLELPACRRFSGGLRIIVTTDVGLRRLRPSAAPGPTERFVALRTSAFADAGGTDVTTPPPADAWIWIDDPARVPHCLRRARREVPFVS